MITRSTSQGVAVGTAIDGDAAALAIRRPVLARLGLALRARNERLGRATRELLPGLVLAGAVGLVAHLCAKAAFPYALAVGLEVPLAMFAGLLVVNLRGCGERANPGIRFAVKYVLGFGIVLLGLRLNLHAIAGVGSEAIWLVLLGMGSALGFALLVGNRLNVERRVAVLIGIGCSVCGNSAIAAAAPVVRANEREMSFAVATITIFGTLAVLVFPLIGHALGLDVLTFGLWAGTAVPDTAQTIAASAAYDTVGRDVAVVVKLLRTVLLAPLLLLIVWGFTRVETGTVSTDAARRGIRKAVPFFVVGFVALALVRTLGFVDGETVLDFDPLTRACFLIALAGLGLQTRMTNLRSLGLRPFLLGLGTSTVLAGGTLAAIVAFGVGPARTEARGSVDPRPLGHWTPVCGGEAPRCEGNWASGATTGATSRSDLADSQAADSQLLLTGHVLATGIPGAGALSPVGKFHPGGPMHDQRDFAATTEPGEVLDPARLLVASTSNFGAPAARADWAAGSILSLATDAPAALELRDDFAASGEQAEALDGAAKLYTAQAPGFLNRVPNAGAETAAMPAVSNPLGISVNNAFGRPWFANAPVTGSKGIGVESVLDPDGRPLSEAPSERAGGVFAGATTNRDPQREPGGLESGAVGNAFLGASPDASGRAVFAVATADGAIAQVHVEDGVDGLAPPGTIAPVAPDGERAGAAGELRNRVGMAFNWVPDRFLSVSDPNNDAVLQLQLDDDFEVFEVSAARRLESAYFSAPIDLAPAVPEVANPAFSSNTTLAGGADIYVANRGSGQILRMRQDGRIRAVAEVRLPGLGPVGAGRLNGIAVSPDARKIWVSLSDPRAARPELSGSIVELPAFGAPK